MVIWTLRARTDLKAIHDYIAKDSRQNAKRVAHEVRHKAEALAEPPHVGRKVPELNDPKHARSQRAQANAASWALRHPRELAAKPGTHPCLRSLS